LRPASRLVSGVASATQRLPLPTRRSSDLLRPRPPLPARPRADRGVSGDRLHVARRVRPARPRLLHQGPARLPPAPPQLRERSLRSEEHTSELQSRENLVCRLLLETKKTQT